MKFKVYYERHGKEEFPTYTGDPFDTPAMGVLVIVEESKEHGRRLVTNGDYYVWDGARWWPTDMPGLFQYLNKPGPRRVLLGVMVDMDEWNKVMWAATNDPEFPAKTGYDFYEAKPDGGKMGREGKA